MTELPLFPLTSVGSFPKQDYLLAARRAYAKKEMVAEDLRALEQTATREWIEFQEKIGLDVLVDGEQYRGDMVAYFADHLRGFTQGSLVESYGNRFYKKPVITGNVSWQEPITVDFFQFAQGLTEKPVKAIVTGPYTMYHWSFDDHYARKEDAIIDLAQAVRQEVVALVNAGAKYVQIDEPALSAVPDDLPLVKNGLDIVTTNISGIEFFTHICYGKFEKIYPPMLDLPIDNYDLEIANRDFQILPLLQKYPFTKKLSLGVLDVHSHEIESPQRIKNLLDQALTVIPAERLWVSPDCGLKTRTVEEAKRKLEVMARTVREFRNGYS